MLSLIQRRTGSLPLPFCVRQTSKFCGSTLTYITNSEFSQRPQICLRWLYFSRLHNNTFMILSQDRSKINFKDCRNFNWTVVCDIQKKFSKPSRSLIQQSNGFWIISHQHHKCILTQIMSTIIYYSWHFGDDKHFGSYISIRTASD